MVNERRRTHLGKYASAALPALWKAKAKAGWSDADFARELAKALGREHPAAGFAAKLLYGDFKPSKCSECSPVGAAVRGFCTRLGVRPVLWDKACPPNWKPHAYDALRPKPKAKTARASSPFPVLGATGTDD